jgi:hypothetical protein
VRNGDSRNHENDGGCADGHQFERAQDRHLPRRGLTR